MVSTVLSVLQLLTHLMNTILQCRCEHGVGLCYWIVQRDMAE